MKLGDFTDIIVNTLWGTHGTKYEDLDIESAGANKDTIWVSLENDQKFVIKVFEI